ncbi:MAG: FHA domain-containing protein [Actinomycetota bacterium]
MATLIVRDGPLRGRRIELGTDEVTIGRENTAVVIEDDSEVSRNHAVVRSSDGVEIEDAGSTNGTFVNERRISGPTPLNHGDVVRVGQTRLDVEVEEDPNQTRVSGVVAPPTQEHSAPSPPANDDQPKQAAAPEPAADAPQEPAAQSDVDELQVPASQGSEPAPAEADREMRAPTSELPTRSKVGGGAVHRAGSNKRNLVIAAAAVGALIVGFLLYSLIAGGAPSRADYVASVNDICREDMARLNELNVNRAGSTERAASLVAGMTGEIDGLERPEGDERQIDRFIASFERVGAGFEDLNTSQRANNERRARDAARQLQRATRRFDRAARSLGTGQCAFETSRP